MSRGVRYVGGDTRKVAYRVNPNFAIQKGDLVYQDPTDKMIRPATAIMPAATEALAQLDFAQYFVGVADEKAGLATGEFSFNLAFVQAQSTIAVCTAGKFEFDCPAQTFQPNAMVGIYSPAWPAGISDAQTVDAVATANNASQMIGVVSQQEAMLAAGTYTPGTGPGLGGSAPTLVTQTRVVVDIIVQRPLGTIPAAGTYTGTSGQ